MRQPRFVPALVAWSEQAFIDHLQVLETKISSSEALLQRLELEHKQVDSELELKVVEAQRASQDLNISVDKLDSFNKAIERSVIAFAITLSELTLPSQLC